MLDRFGPCEKSEHSSALVKLSAMRYFPAPAGSPFARWRLYERLLSVMAGGTLMVLLATAATLQPSQSGLGTHRQLGLPPCTVVAWFDIRCPSCGMTTAWAHVLRGQVWAGLRANAGGVLLAVVAATCGPWLVASGLLGRWLIRPPGDRSTLVIAVTIASVTLMQWTLRLSLGW